MARKQIRNAPNLPTRFQLSPARRREIFGIALFAVGVLTFLSLLRVTPGVVSDLWSNVLRSLFGWGAFALPVFLFVGGAFLLRRGDADKSVGWGRIFAAEIFFAALLALIHLVPPSNNSATLASNGTGGGFIGWMIGSTTASLIGIVPAVILFVVICLFSLPAIVGLNAAHLSTWSDALAARAERTKIGTQQLPFAKTPAFANPQPVEREAPKPAAPEGQVGNLPNKPNKPRPVFGIKPAIKPAPAEPQVLLTPRERWRRKPNLPGIELFDAANEAKYGQTDANLKARLIEETLAQFGIPVKVIEINAGPTITQFGIEPGFITRRGLDGESRPRKVSVSRIAALQHDLELALAAAPIRIETPVPGRAIVGVEVPNQSISVVALRGILENESLKNKKNPLMIALGRDVSGNAIGSDLAGMPHLLIAGATGSGKSVCINAIIACLLKNNSPDDLRLLMVDPKRVELTNFNGIPHLVGPVVVNMDEVVSALRWVTREMDSRFTLFAKKRVRNIDAFNEKAVKENGSKMPFLVVIVDELADLMLVAAEDTERLLTRLAQLARATGIHLVLATQRPSVDVVTGLIKANFPARISFAVTSSVDSRVVLDTPGAEKLLGRGDMLYMASDSSKLSRLQGCFVSDEEIARLVNFWRKEIMAEGYELAKEPPWKSMPAEAKEGSDEALIAQAIELVRQYDRTSISFLQRKLGIGYPRAARLVDLLEERGAVGPDEGGGSGRPVMIQEGDAKHLEVDEPKRKK